MFALVRLLWTDCPASRDLDSHRAFDTSAACGQAAGLLRLDLTGGGE